MKTALALVHHANQYLITNGYDNREGIDAVIGGISSGTGIAGVLELHRRYQIPLNFHISGTLLEAIAWHQPEFLKELRGFIETGLVELVGSCYGQNIMRFFPPDYNLRQLNEELELYQTHLGVDPCGVKIFWPPERVWDVRTMPPVLRDANLLNDGYKYVILDDRLLMSPDHPVTPRSAYDREGHWDEELFRMHEIENGLGLLALPIATRLRRSIPPREHEDWQAVREDLEAVLVQSSHQSDFSLLAVYADDMEKVAGIGEWGPEGPERYAKFLAWVAEANWVRPVRLSRWAKHVVAGKRKIERGTFQELAQDFDAGESYEKWYFAPDWAPYRGYFNWADTCVRKHKAEGADRALIELAEKQLLVANWETAWHTPSSGPHGDSEQHGHASPWARALTSHSRHAAVTALAAAWMKRREEGPGTLVEDHDHDGEADVVLRNRCLYTLITARWGGRVISLYSIGGERGALVVGNPCDDWNWMEELNKFMETPRNHPGAFADVGFENDRYDVQVLDGGSSNAKVRLTNVEPGSRARGLIKEYTLDESCELSVDYTLPPTLGALEVECGLSPDYLELLRHGSEVVRLDDQGAVRGFSAGNVHVWVRLPEQDAVWVEPEQKTFGHGFMLRLKGSARRFRLQLGSCISEEALDHGATQLESVLP